MAVGILWALFGAGLRGTASIKNSMEDSRYRRETDDGFTYKDRHYNEYLCSNGHRVEHDVVNSTYNRFNVGDARVGDRIIYDTVTKEIVKNKSRRTPEQEAEAQEKAKKAVDKIMDYVAENMRIEDEMKKVSEEGYEIGKQIDKLKRLQRNNGEDYTEEIAKLQIEKDKKYDKYTELSQKLLRRQIEQAKYHTYC